MLPSFNRLELGKNAVIYHYVKPRYLHLDTTMIINYCINIYSNLIKIKLIRRHKIFFAGNQRMSYEERELQLKLANLNKEVAKAAEELARAAQITLESESAAVEASTVAEQAAVEAKRIQVL